MVIANHTDGFGNQISGRIEIPILMLATGTSAPAATAVVPFRGYAYTLLPGADDSDAHFIMPDDWATGTPMNVSIRWNCNENYALNSGEVNWQIDYETLANDASQVMGNGTTGTFSSGDIDIPTTALQLTENLIGAIPAASLAAGDTVGLTLTRIALVGGANPAAEPVVYGMFIDYTRFLPHYGA